MKVTVEFNVDWKNYSDELVIEDMFENWPGKEGVKIESYKVERNSQ